MTKVISLRKKYKSNFNFSKKTIKKTKNNNHEIFILIFLVFAILAIFIGCIIYKNYSINFINEICSKFINKLQNGTYIDVLIEFLKIDILFYLLMFFIGSSFIGLPLTIIPVVIKCSLIGYLSSYMYCEYDLKGLLFSLILIYPIFVISTTSLIYSANESVYMSKYLFNNITNKNTADNISIKLYLIRYAILLGINVLCITVSSFLIVILANKINLH